MTNEAGMNEWQKRTRPIPSAPALGAPTPRHSRWTGRAASIKLPHLDFGPGGRSEEE
jgi:hypothetical protein